MKRIILFMYMAGMAISAMSQPSLPSKVTAKKPELLNKGLLIQPQLDNEFRNGSKWGQKKTIDYWWIAWSDRDNNQAYMEPRTNSQKAKTLGFGERVVIAQIEGDMALVYIDPKTEKFPIIPSYAKSVGWIPMDHLLLWNTCPADTRGVLRKALIAINLNEMGQNENYQGVLYTNPDDVTSSEKLKMDMNFYYIMKETPDGQKALLCQQSSFTGNNLYGWVKKNSYTPWNQRTCLEPNWSPAFVEAHKGQKAFIYTNSNMLDGDFATFWTFGDPNGDKARQSQYRMNPAQLRFPILSKPEGNSVKCTAFADRTGNINAAANFTGNIYSKVEGAKGEIEKLNVIIAVEATTEMSEYLPAIKEAIGRCKKDGLKIGLVLYRTEAEGDAGLSIIPLTNPDDARLVSMLDAGKASAKLVGDNRTVAVSKAVETATEPSRMGFNREQRNLLLIVGNHGMSDNNVSLLSQGLLKRLVDNNIQMMSIQVMRNGTGSWARYTDQMTELIVNNMRAQYKSISARVDFRPTKAGDGYNFYSSRENVLFASIRYGNTLGKALTPQEVGQYIRNGITKFGETVEQYKATFQKALDNIDFYPEFVTKILGPNGYKAWKDVKAISAWDGYAKLKASDGSDYWHYILYLSQGELDDLIQKLKRTDDAAQAGSKDRTHYINAIRALIKAQLPDTEDKYLENMSTEELQEAIYGINIPTKIMSFTKYSLQDISNSNVVKHAEYIDILDHFHKQYEELKNLSQSSNKYRLQINNVYYYWIPLEDLP